MRSHSSGSDCCSCVVLEDNERANSALISIGSYEIGL